MYFIHQKEFLLKISIITAVFNAEKTIDRCVRSVSAQKNADFEHLLIDNRSSDHTLEIAQKINPDIHAVSEPDNGIYDAMNKGAALAAGEILAWLNADDAYLPDTLEKVSAYFAAHPEIDILHGNISVNGNRVVPPSGTASFGGFRIFHPAAFIRRSAFMKYGPFHTEYKICADLDFFLSAGQAGAKFTYMDAIFTDFALGGLSTKRRKETAKEVRQILLSHGYSSLYANAWYGCMRARAFASALLHQLKK